jgi:hypothetical protein
MGSKNLSVNKEEVNKVIKNAVLVSLAAGLTFISTKLSVLDLGPMAPLVVPVISTLLESVITWVKDNTKE